MSRDPLLKSVRFTRDRRPWRLEAFGGLHYIKGNHAPYFSLTGAESTLAFGQWHERSGGAIHPAILKRWPSLSDLAALHLSDIDGVPLLHEANGWYQLAGYFGGAGEKYHAGSSKRTCPDGYREPTPEECLQSFAEHCRMPLERARGLAGDIRDGGPAWGAARIDWTELTLRERWAHAAAAMLPRFKVEAGACIAKHGLTVYGDPWPVAPEGAASGT